MNEYTQMACHYDNLMTSGYYDYQALAESLADFIADGDTALEVGVGTGLLIERLAPLRPRCRLTGVDFTLEMLNIAERRVGGICHLVHADVTSMALGDKFDVIFTCGGVWVVIDTGEESQLCSHIPDVDQNMRALRNTMAHLKSGGLFLLSIQGTHDDYEKPLRNGVIYRQKVKWRGDLFDKDYVFQDANGTVVRQRNTFRIWHQSQMLELLDDCGLEPIGRASDQRFRVFRRI